MSSYFECGFFKEPKQNQEEFSVLQEEILFHRLKNSGEAIFNKLSVKYICRWKKHASWDPQLPAIIIPIKDNTELLEKTLTNLRTMLVSVKSNVIVVDDRSATNIASVATNFGVSYLRVDNSKGFNFSMLNNIAVKLSHDEGCREVIFWNSDLWCAKEEWFDELLKRHRETKSVVSGAKLVYPPEGVSFTIGDPENMVNNFPHLAGRWRETVQFGGSAWVQDTNSSALHKFPAHYGRFFTIEDPRVNNDKGVDFVTGALHVWSAARFIEMGGFNPSLSKNFQDVDVCTRVLKSGDVPMYFGKDIFFYHDESVSLEKEGKQDSQLFSDLILYGKIWNNKQ